MRLIDADLLYYEDIECTDGNIYMVVYSPEIDNAEIFDLAEHDKQVRDEVIEEMVKEIDDVDMDSNYIYLKFDKEKYDIPNQITRKSELKDWVLEQMKGETE